VIDSLDVMALHPIGPLPASVYWRRRLVLLAVLVALVVVLKSCVGGGEAPKRTSAGPTATPSRSSAARPSPTATRTPARTGPVSCTDAMLRLTVTSDAKTYPVGSSPRFVLRVANTSDQSCRRDLGGKPLELRVYSGEDRIWSSDDCGDTTTSSVQTIAAHSYLETTMTWPGTRSRPGCSGDRSKAQPGTYYVRLSVGTARTSGAVFRLREA
jgi:hypothetical protein